MKATGITRPVDPLGRVVIPKELRSMLNISESDRMEIWVDGETVLMRKYQPHCVFCDETENLISFNGKLVCKNCAAALSDEIKDI